MAFENPDRMIIITMYNTLWLWRNDLGPCPTTVRNRTNSHSRKITVGGEPVGVTGVGGFVQVCGLGGVRTGVVWV